MPVHSPSQSFFMAGLGFALACSFVRPAAGIEIVVAPSGGSYTSIQAALNQAQAGDSVTVRTGTYNEKLAFPRSGNASNGPIVLRAYPGETAIVDGQNRAGQDMIRLDNRDYIRIQGLEIRNNTNVTDGSGIRLTGACRHVAVEDNVIHDMRGVHAMGITVYGNSATPSSNIVICGNRIYDCEPAASEALTLNGNITDFDVSSNVVYDVNNIGIDFIGGETEVSVHGSCRNGVCRGNHVYRARSNYGDGYAAGIYVDGGRNILLEHNRIHHCDLGLEIGAENAGFDATGIVVRSNLIYSNDKAGLVFGGYESAGGRTRNCIFENNTCWKNDALQAGNGELWIQWASNNRIENNLFYSGPQNLLLGSSEGNTLNKLDYNLWFSEAGESGCTFQWNGAEYNSFAEYRLAAGQDVHSFFGNPQLTNATAEDFHLSPASPARDAGQPTYRYSLSEKDIDGESRVMGDRIDIGADEMSHYDIWRDQAFFSVQGYSTNREAYVFSRAGDPDGDACDNETEFLGHTDPLSPESFFRVNDGSFSSANQLQLMFSARTNRTYKLITRSPSAAGQDLAAAYSFCVTASGPFSVMSAPLTAAAAWLGLGIHE
ncbi:MAG TPA: DUF5123 domain-containing protein [Verrucomicrobia bacterium]|nr:MAG: hypothetical protein A2X46_08895 [Lentisphaerae bacterium GWF2_57_35]HBA82721.1 DUF5123 domain-containing protein [Verrucomicrobiota bacterium]